MWKLVSTFRVLNRTCRLHAVSPGRRYFLSESFKCEDAWQKRLQTPILQTLSLDELLQALDQKFNHSGKASVIDIDLFVNAVRDEHYSDEVEDIIHKLRLSSNTTKTLPSTPHAVIRYFLKIEQYESLIRILNDRLNYGIFLDNYSLCLILDTFIKKKMISEAARLCTIHMLQEDWSCPLATSLALYACHLYTQNPVPWKDDEVEDSGEEIKIRVKYLRNPYFDDHFDLRDPQLLIGKTLAAIGATMPDAIGQTYRLIGLGLHRKWEKAMLHIQQLSNKSVKPALFKSGVKMFEELCERELNDQNPEANLRENFKRLLGELEQQKLVTNDDLDLAVVSKVKQIVEKEEQNMISAQITMYEEWEIMRDRLLKEQVEELRREQRLAAIEQEKQQLIQKEKELFFFDNEEKIDVLLEKEELQKKEDEAKQKGKAKKKDDSDYIPPEIRSSMKS